MLGVLPLHDEAAQCCGWGGQPAIANPEYARFVTERRIAESDLPYIAYCINCRDVFLEAGKEAKHILEILFPEQENVDSDIALVAGAGTTYAAAESATRDPRRPTAASTTENPRLPTATERRERRIALKRYLYKKYTENDMENERKDLGQTYDFRLFIDDALKQKISNEWIIESDLYVVLEDLLRTGRTVRNEESGIRSGYKQIGKATLWIDFKEGTEPGVYILMGAYAHRMAIEMEGVWNGNKTETDL
jgi:hypothetical protein